MKRVACGSYSFTPEVARGLFLPGTASILLGQSLGERGVPVAAVNRAKTEQMQPDARSRQLSLHHRGTQPAILGRKRLGGAAWRCGVEATSP